MIVTLTPNPSIDRTVTLSAPLTRGAVHRAVGDHRAGRQGRQHRPGPQRCGVDAVAVLPASGTDPLLTPLSRRDRRPQRPVPAPCGPT